MRQYELIIGVPIVLSGTINMDDYLKDNEENAYRVTDLNIDFEIRKDNTHQPNKGYITLYNLPDGFVEYINQNAGKPLAILLRAGYTDTGMNTLFSGEVSFFEDNWDGDLITRKTKLTLGDGELALKTATTARSYRTNTKLNTILDDLISDLALPKGQIIRYSDNDVLPFSKSFTGTASENLRNLANSTGRTFSVQDSSIYFTVRGKALPQNIFILNESSGLIGIPTPRTMSAKQEYILQQKKDKTKKEELKKKYQNKEDVGLTVSCLLNGAVLPETTVYLDSIYLKGFYKAVEVIHTGSYEGDGDGSWTTEMKLAEVQGKLE